MNTSRLMLLFFLVVSNLPTMAQTLALLWKTDTILRVPESVCFDAKNKILYVSNIEGKSDEQDGKGSISQLTSDGRIRNLEWVTGLNAPKGMGLIRNTLYVADLTRVVAFEATTGEMVNTFEIEGAKFLNDITVDSHGDVYVSDSGTGKIHRISNNTVELYFESPELKKTNGLLALKNGLYVADAGSGINYKLTSDKKLIKFSETSPGADGVAPVGKDEYIVSSWGGEIFYVDANGKATKMLDTKEKKLNSADIDYDPRTKTVFIPTFYGNNVMAYTFRK